MDNICAVFRYADSIGVGDLYKTMKKMPNCDFLTNTYLGVGKYPNTEDSR